MEEISGGITVTGWHQNDTIIANVSFFCKRCTIFNTLFCASFVYLTLEKEIVSIYTISIMEMLYNL